MNKVWISYLLVLTQVCIILLAIKHIDVNSLLDNSIQIWFDKNDSTVEVYEEEKLIFGNKTWVIIALELDKGRKDEWLSTVDNLTYYIEGLNSITRVLSPTNFEVLRLYDGYLEYATTYSQGMNYVELLSRLKEHPVAGDLLTSSNDDAVWYILAQESSDHSSPGYDRQKLIDSLTSHLDSKNIIKRYALTGPTVINVELNKLSWNDFLKLMPFTVLLACITLYALVSGRIRSILPMLFVTGLSTFCTLSIMLLFGYPFNMMTISLPGLVFCLGLASGTHVLFKYKNNPFYRAEDITRCLWKPMLTSHITTSAGFFSLAYIAITPVQIMAVFGMAGVLIALLNSLLVLPNLVIKYNKCRPGEVRWHGYKGTRRLTTLTSKVFSYVVTDIKARLFVYSIILLATIAMVVGLSNLKFDSTYLDMVSKNEKMNRYYQTLNELDSFSASLSILFNKNSAGFTLTNSDLMMLTKIKNEIEKHPAVIKVVGPSDIFDEVSPFFPEGNDPDIRTSDVFAFSFTGGSNNVADYITADFKTLRLQVFFQYMQNSKLNELINNYLKSVLQSHIDKNHTFDYEISGIQVLWANMDAAVYDGQIKSAVIMFLVACVTFGLMLKSFSLSLLSVFINFIPILTILALFGLLDINIDMASVFILGISLGIAIDDTAYFVYNFKVNRTKYESFEAVRQTLFNTAPPIMTTTLIIFIGFIVLVQSNFIPMQKFGLFISVGIVVAMLTDLFLLPYFTYKLQRKENL